VPHFSPEWLARTGTALEPIVERLVGVRVPTCGQLLAPQDATLMD
jgi:hypothetical protein